MTEDKEQPNTVIEDLTLRETETADVKGGAVDMLLMRFVGDGVKGESKGDTHK